MIQITLSFTSMSAARKALLELPENLFADVEVKAEPAKKSELKAEVKAESAKKPELKADVKAEPVKQEAVPSPEPKAETAAVEYPVLQKAVFTLAGKSREAAAEVAASFGVKTFKELAADKWADALAAVQAKIAEL